MTTRTGTIWIPDWPLVVALAVHDLPPTTPAIVSVNKRVHVASGYARNAGIRTNMPIRHAQELLPGLHVLPAHDTLEAKEFEYIAQLAETLIPHIDILRPGILTFGANGPTRYFGTEQALAEKITDLLAVHAQVEAHVGFAEGLLASVLSARAMRPVPLGETARFLAGRPLQQVQYALTTNSVRTRVTELVQLWDRLGIRTFGQLAALPRTKVQARFGGLGTHIYDLAHGKDLHAGATQHTKPEICVEHTLEHPAVRVDEAAFYARRLAQQMHEELLAQSATCGRIAVSARMSDGTEVTRSWRTDDSALGAISPERLTQRVRWQLEGWLTNSALRERARATRKTAGVADAQELDPHTHASNTYASTEHTDSENLRAELNLHEHLEQRAAVQLEWLQLTALDVIGAATHQESLWGTSSATDIRAHRAAERTASLIGPHNVHAIQLTGGRTYQERIHHTPWEDAPPTTQPQPITEPWPGALPSPAPTLLYTPPRPITLTDHNGTPITVTNRLMMSGPPHLLHWHDQPHTPPLHVLDWAGPWPISTGWWRTHPQHHLYLQLISTQHHPLLVSYTHGQWHCEGTYD